MQIVSIGDNLHDISNPVFWEKYKKNIISLSSAELAKSVIKVNFVGCLGISDNFKIVSFHFYPSLSALGELAKSRPTQSLTLSSHRSCACTFLSFRLCLAFCYENGITDNRFYTNARYNDKIHYNDNLTHKTTLKR